MRAFVPKPITKLILSASLLTLITSSLETATLLGWDFGTSNGNDVSVSAATVEASVLSSLLTRGAEFSPTNVVSNTGRGAFATDTGAQRPDLASALAERHRRSGEFEWRDLVEEGARLWRRHARE